MFTAELAISGLAIGCVAALSGIGLSATYRLTGVFNLAFGAIAMLAAYLLWQAVSVWHLPVLPSASVDLLVVMPGIGLLLERLVFRPLHRRRAAPAEQLVATLGVFVLLVGIAYVVWGPTARLDPPSVLPGGSVSLGTSGLVVGDGTLAEVCVVAVVGVLMTVVLRATRVGLLVRGVVDSRELAELCGIRADRVASLGWMFGAFLAGLTGVLLAPTIRLDPYGLTLIVLETMGVAVAARLSSLTVTVFVALALGVAQSELTQLRLGGVWDELGQAIRANLFVVALLVALLALPGLAERRARGLSETRLGGDAGAASRFSTRRESPPTAGWWLPYVVLLAVPLVLDDSDLRAAQAVPAYAVIFVSLVVVTGYGGQVSLGQAGYAGLGALLTARLTDGTFFGLGHVPVLGAMFLGPALLLPVGLVTGWPAIRRSGLYLALTTFAVAAIVSRFVFEQPAFTAGVSVLRPAGFTGDRMFYLLELCCLGLALSLVNALHTGPLGRALLAMRDSESGARSAGIDVGRMKVFVFTVSAGLAGLGGALAAMSTRSFDPTAFDPIQGLIWFAAVIVAGADSAAGTLVAAAGIVALDTGLAVGASTMVIGLGAVLLGRTPGGVAPAIRRLAVLLAATPDPPPAAPSVNRGQVRLSPAGRRVAMMVAQRRVSAVRRDEERAR